VTETGAANADRGIHTEPERDSAMRSAPGRKE